MKQILFTVSVVAFAFFIGTAAYAQGRPADAGQRPAAGQQRTADDMSRRSEARRDEAEARRGRAEANNRSAEARAEHPPNEHATEGLNTAEEKAGRDGKADEMRERRDEDTAIKEEYRDTRSPGQEGVVRDDGDEEVTEKQSKKAKKPWWKFWGE